MKFGSKLYFKIEKASIESMGVTKPTSDFNQWLHAMKMVAVLPGGMPSEFRKKLWLALADKYLQTRKINWSKEQVKCLSEQWRTDDEELGIQIVKDLHRTGSSLCSGPMGSSNQAKLKKVLVGYARWNPEIGYCQGFNMLGALILQVMDKNEADSIKIMILLIEGILPQGYFSGSLSGLQADMAVFRELLATKLPKLSKHLQKLQGPSAFDNFEPPLINVFTMQWFLTLFCTCLPLNCVLRVWDLILIEGSDILLRTALTLWDLLEPRIMSIKTADDFYCKMGLISGEILSGNLIDTNGLVQKIVDLGAIEDLKQLRDKHLNSISPLRDKKGIMLFYSDDDGESDSDSKLAVASAWEIKNGRRPSIGSTQNTRTNSFDNKDRIALDISILKQQYAKIRERQRQAHIILTSACARQSSNSASSSIPINQLLSGRNAILSRKGRRVGPPQGAIPPARKSVPNKQTKSSPLNQPKTPAGETLHWKDTEAEKKRRNSIKWRDLKSNEASESEASSSGSKPKCDNQIKSDTSKRSEAKTSTSRKRSESSSYSDDSDDSCSSTSTSLCDDDHQKNSCSSSYEQSPIKMKLGAEKASTEIARKSIDEIKSKSDNLMDFETECPPIESSSISVVDNSITLVECENIKDLEKCPSTLDVQVRLADTVKNVENDGKSSLFKFNLDNHINRDEKTELKLNLSDILMEKSEADKPPLVDISQGEPYKYSPPQYISSVSQLSPIPDISTYISTSNISPLKSPTPVTDFITDSLPEYSPPDDEIITAGIFDMTSSSKEETTSPKYKVNEDGVTNEFFEHISLIERPKNLDIIDIFSPDHLNYKNVAISSFEQPSSPTTTIQVPFQSNNLVLDLPISTYENQPILPPCTDISAIGLIDIGPQKTEIVTELKIDTELPNVRENIPKIKERDSSVFLDRLRFSKLKSVSLDEPSLKDQAYGEMSSHVGPQATKSNSDNSIIGKNSDRVLKIIQENSIILHRILKRNTSKYADSMIKYYDDKNVVAPPTGSQVPPTDPTVMPTETTKNFKNFGNSINLSDTITSIENTIKSINKLCGKSDEVEKQFEYIKPATFEDIVAQPSIKLDECECISPPVDKGEHIEPIQPPSAAESPDMEEVSITSDLYTLSVHLDDDSTKSKSPSNFSRISDQSSDLYKMNNSILEQYRNSEKTKLATTEVTTSETRFDLRKYEYLSKSVCESSDTDIPPSGLFQRYFSEEKDTTLSTPSSPKPLNASTDIETFKSPSYDFLKPIADRIIKSAESSPSRHKFTTLINDPFNKISLNKNSNNISNANCDNQTTTCSDSNIVNRSKDQIDVERAPQQPHFSSCDSILTKFKCDVSLELPLSQCELNQNTEKSVPIDIEIDKLV